MGFGYYSAGMNGYAQDSFRFVSSTDRKKIGHVRYVSQTGMILSDMKRSRPCLWRTESFPFHASFVSVHPGRAPTSSSKSSSGFSEEKLP